MFKRVSVGQSIRKQVQNNVGLQVSGRYSSVQQPKISNNERVEKVQDEMKGEGLRDEPMTMSKAVEQANSIQFGSGSKSTIKGVNRYSDVKSAMLNQEIKGSGSVVNDFTSNRKDETDQLTLGKARLPGEILKRKLLLKMLKEKDKEVATGKKELNGGGLYPMNLKSFMEELSKMKGGKIILSKLPQDKQLKIKKSFDKIKLDPSVEKIKKLFEKLQL